MAIKPASNLRRNRFGILYFQLTFYVDLQKHFAAKVIDRILRTSNICAAVDANTLQVSGNCARAVCILNQTFNELMVEQHPDKTFIGRIEKDFDFLGYYFSRSALRLANKRYRIMSYAFNGFMSNRKRHPKVPLSWMSM